MSLASAAGAGRYQSSPTRPSIVSRTGLFALLGCVAGGNAFAGRIATTLHDQSILAAILSLGGVSAIVWFAIGSLFTLSGEGDGPPALRPSDKGMAALILFLSFVPLNFAGAIGLLLSGLYLAVTTVGGSSGRRMAMIMLALTGPLIWGRFLLALAGPLLLALDARIAGLLAGVPVQGNVVGLRGGGTLYVALGCSSVHNMSLAVLLFVTLTQMLRLRYTPSLLLTGAGAALAMAVVNELRLASLARFPQYFDLIHTGWGGTLYGALSFLAAGAIIAGGIHAQRSR